MGQSLTHTQRQMGRARNTAEVVIAAPDGQYHLLKTIAPDMKSQSEAVAAAIAATLVAEKSSAKEVRESLETLAPLAKVFDQARLLGDKGGFSYPAASTYATPDDLLRDAEQLEADLEAKKAEPWAASMLALLQPAVDKAAKESSEANAALKALQKAQMTRDQAIGVARPVFVNFRRAVRATFGRSSREYRELLDRRGSSEDDDDPNAPVPPAPTGPAPVTPQPT